MYTVTLAFSVNMMSAECFNSKQEFLEGKFWKKKSGKEEGKKLRVYSGSKGFGANIFGFLMNVKSRKAVTWR